MLKEILMQGLANSFRSRMKRGKKLVVLTHEEKAANKSNNEKLDRIHAQQERLDLEKENLAVEAKRWWFDIQDKYRVKAPMTYDQEQGVIYELVEQDQEEKDDCEKKDGE